MLTNRSKTQAARSLAHEAAQANKTNRLLTLPAELRLMIYEELCREYPGHFWLQHSTPCERTDIDDKRKTIKIRNVRRNFKYTIYYMHPPFEECSKPQRDRILARNGFEYTMDLLRHGPKKAYQLLHAEGHLPCPDLYKITGQYQTKYGEVYVCWKSPRRFFILRASVVPVLMRLCSLVRAEFAAWMYERFTFHAEFWWWRCDFVPMNRALMRIHVGFPGVKKLTLHMQMNEKGAGVCRALVGLKELRSLTLHFEDDMGFCRRTQKHPQRRVPYASLGEVILSLPEKLKSIEDIELALCGRTDKDIYQDWCKELQVGLKEELALRKGVSDSQGSDSEGVGLDGYQGRVKNFFGLFRGAQLPWRRTANEPVA